MRTVAPIRTARLELVSLTPSFVEAIVATEPAAASREIGAAVTPWLGEALRRAFDRRFAGSGELPKPPWIGRAITLVDERGIRRAIGSIDFAGPPDELGRIEVGYRVEPAYRGKGYATEAIAAVFDWAARRHGVRRVAAAITPTGGSPPLVGARITFRDIGPEIEEIDGLELVFEADWPPES